MSTVHQIPVESIDPSPFQHRRVFDAAKLAELAKSIQEHGLIQPIVVRPSGKRFELVCGERRLRASKLCEIETILAVVREYDDKQARIACLSENVQRADLSKVEEIEGIAEWVDAYMDGNADGYRKFLAQHLKAEGKAGRKFKISGCAPDLNKPLHRAALLLTLFESDRKNGTAISSKFTANLTAAFEAIKRGVDATSFATNDLPLILMLEQYEEIKQAAIEKGLNKSQVQAVVEVAQTSGKRAAAEILDHGVEDFDGTKVPVEESSAKEIRAVANREKFAQVHVAFNSGENEWYTPPEFITAARAVMGEIDLDPASCELANRTVGAKQFYSEMNNGLDKEWFGRVWMNPPYAQPLISDFCSKLLSEFASENTSEACVLVNNATDTTWFQDMMTVATAICFTRGRVRFIDQNGKASGAPLQGQAIIYFGSNAQSFRNEFRQFGFVL